VDLVAPNSIGRDGTAHLQPGAGSAVVYAEGKAARVHAVVGISDIDSLKPGPLHGVWVPFEVVSPVGDVPFEVEVIAGLLDPGQEEAGTSDVVHSYSPPGHIARVANDHAA